MARNIIHFGKRADGSPALSIGAHPDDATNTLIISAWGQPISLNAMEAADVLDFLAKYRAAIFALAEKHEQNRRYALLQEIEQLAQALHFDIQIEDGLIDVISKHISQGGQAASFRSDLDGFAAALKWLKARAPEGEA